LPPMRVIAPESVREERGPGEHPLLQDLEDFMAGRLSGRRASRVVRHLLGGCDACASVTRQLWGFDRQPLPRRPALRLVRSGGGR